MARHFGPHNMRDGYAAMGGSLRRPHYSGVDTQRSIAASIARERQKAEVARRVNSKKK